MGLFSLPLCLLVAIRALDRRRSWLWIPLWAGSVLLLAFTRDAAAIVVAAAVLVALAQRTRRALAVAGTAILAALPAPLLFGAPLRETLAFTFSGNDVPKDASWSFVLHNYWPHVQAMLRGDFRIYDAKPISMVLLGAVLLLGLGETDLRATKARRLGIIVAVGLGTIAALPTNSFVYGDPLFVHLTGGFTLNPGTVVLLAIVPLFLPASSGDTFIRLMRAGATGALAYLFLLPQYTGFRLPLVLLPFAAVGLARAASLWPRMGCQAWSRQLSRATSHLPWLEHASSEHAARAR
jgi:hypothetical protein